MASEKLEHLRIVVDVGSDGFVDAIERRERVRISRDGKDDVVTTDVIDMSREDVIALIERLPERPDEPEMDPEPAEEG